MKKIAMAVLTMSLSLHLSAQTEAVSETKERKMEHHIGVQANALIREVINFSNNNNVKAANPYFLTYNVNYVKTGWGFRAGVGYTYNSSNKNDGVTNTVNDVNDVNARLGVEKAFKLTRKWSSGVGLDLVYNNESRTTSNSVSSGVGGGNIGIKTKVLSTGGGPMAWLRYNINERIVLGTETSFYFVTGEESQTLSVTGSVGSGTGGFPSVSSPSNTVSKAEFNLPIAFFILVRF